MSATGGEGSGGKGPPRKRERRRQSDARPDSGGNSPGSDASPPESVSGNDGDGKEKAGIAGFLQRVPRKSSKHRGERGRREEDKGSEESRFLPPRKRSSGASDGSERGSGRRSERGSERDASRQGGGYRQFEAEPVVDDPVRPGEEPSRGDEPPGYLWLALRLPWALTAALFRGIRGGVYEPLYRRSSALVNAAGSALSDPDTLRRILRAALFSTLGLYAAVASLLAADSIAASGKVYPSVYIGDLAVGGQTLEEAMGTFRSETRGGNLGTYEFLVPADPLLGGEAEAGGSEARTFEYAASEAGIELRIRRAAYEAYFVGREGSVAEQLTERLKARMPAGRAEVPAGAFSTDLYESEVLSEISGEVEQRPVNAGVRIEGGEAGPSDGEPRAVLDRHVDGRNILADQSVANLEAALDALSTQVAVAVEQVSPAIRTQGVLEAHAAADRALSGPLVANLVGPGAERAVEAARDRDTGSGATPVEVSGDDPRLEIGEEAVARALEVNADPDAGEVSTSIAGENLASELESALSGALRVEPTDAEITIGDPAAAASEGGIEVAPAEPGAAPETAGFADSAASGEGVLTSSLEHELRVRELEPSFTTGEAERQAPDTLLGEGVTFYEPPDGAEADVDEREVVMERVAESLDNTLIAPGEEVSFLEVTGEGSTTGAPALDPDYEVDDNGEPVGAPETSEGVRPPVADGGGVSQAASALYEAALAAGINVEERSPAPAAPPPYTTPGLEAFVGAASGGQDLVLENDTDGYLRIRASVEGGTVGFRIEGVPPEGSGLEEGSNDSAVNDYSSALESGTEAEPGETWQPTTSPTSDSSTDNPVGEPYTYDYQPPPSAEEGEDSGDSGGGEDEGGGGG